MLSKRMRIIILIFSLGLLVVVSIPTLATILGLPSVPPLPSSLPGRTIYFITNPDTPANEFTSTTRLQKLGAGVATTWEQVIEADQTAGIDALIIDSAALPSVDNSWITNAYRRGIVIAGFNINGSQMANLVNDPCIASNDFANYASGSFFIIVSSSVSGNPEDVDRVLDSYNRSCGEDTAEGVVGTTSVGFRRTTERLESENTFNIFTQVLASHLNR